MFFRDWALNFASQQPTIIFIAAAAADDVPAAAVIFNIRHALFAGPLLLLSLSFPLKFWNPRWKCERGRGGERERRRARRGVGRRAKAKAKND